jgi:hypothetical protein
LISLAVKEKRSSFKAVASLSSVIKEKIKEEDADSKIKAISYTKIPMTMGTVP